MFLKNLPWFALSPITHVHKISIFTLKSLLRFEVSTVYHCFNLNVCNYSENLPLILIGHRHSFHELSLLGPCPRRIPGLRGTRFVRRGSRTGPFICTRWLLIQLKRLSRPLCVFIRGVYFGKTLTSQVEGRREGDQGGPGSRAPPGFTVRLAPHPLGALGASPPQVPRRPVDRCLPNARKQDRNHVVHPLSEEEFWLPPNLWYFID